MISESVLDAQILSEDTDRLPLFPVSASNEFIYLIQAYSFFEGIDIAVWIRDASGKCSCNIYATGPLLLHLPEIDPQSLVVSDDQTIPMRERLLIAMDSLPKIARNRKELLAKAASPLIDHAVEIEPADFEAVVRLCQSIADGCRGLIGSAKAVRVVVRARGESFEFNSWSGAGEPDVTWAAINRLLRAANILDMEMREFHEA